MCVCKTEREKGREKEGEKVGEREERDGNVYLCVGTRVDSPSEDRSGSGVSVLSLSTSSTWEEAVVLLLVLPKIWGYKYIHCHTQLLM